MFTKLATSPTRYSKTAPGYQPDPAYPGMGTVIGTLCRNNTQSCSGTVASMPLTSSEARIIPALEGRDKGRVKSVLLASANGSTSQLFNSSTASTEALYFYHTNHIDTPILMTDQNQNVVWEGEFIPFGEPFSISGTITNNLRFPGQYYDSETDLYQNWHRDYRPETGTYIQKDPIGFEGGDVNLWRYVGNNPVNFVDPLGLTTWPTNYRKITGPYGVQRSNGTHSGIDIRNPKGGTVYASDSGIVIKAWNNGRGGNQILIQHFDRSVSGYAHSATTVIQGQLVFEGQVIGYSDDSGAGPPHLHYTYKPCKGCKVTYDPFEHLKDASNPAEMCR